MGVTVHSTMVYVCERPAALSLPLSPVHYDFESGGEGGQRTRSLLAVKRTTTPRAPLASPRAKSIVFTSITCAPSAPPAPNPRRNQLQR